MYVAYLELFRHQGFLLHDCCVIHLSFLEHEFSKFGAWS